MKVKHEIEFDKDFKQSNHRWEVVSDVNDSLETSCGRTVVLRTESSNAVQAKADMVNGMESLLLQMEAARTAIQNL